MAYTGDEETVLLIAENGEIMAFDMEGKSAAQRTLGLTVYTTPVLLENGSFVVVPTANDAQLRVFTQEMKEDWFFSRSAKTESSDAGKEEK